MEDENESLDKIELLKTEIELASIKVSIALTKRVSSLLTIFKYDETELANAIEMASQWVTPFDLFLITISNPEHMFVDMTRLPSDMLVPLLAMPKMYILEDRWIPVPMVVALMQAPHISSLYDEKDENYITPIKKQKTYLMQDEITGYIKIGRSEDPYFREATLQAQQPKIKIIKVYSKDIESKLHKLFAPNRVRGEWFNATFEEIDAEAQKLMPIV